MGLWIYLAWSFLRHRKKWFSSNVGIFSKLWEFHKHIMCLVQVHLPFPPLQLHSVLPVCTWVLGLSPVMASLSKAASYKNADSQIWGFFFKRCFSKHSLCLFPLSSPFGVSWLPASNLASRSSVPPLRLKGALSWDLFSSYDVIGLSLGHQLTNNTETYYWLWKFGLS